MTSEQLAWAAGFFDGEGSIGAYAGPKTRSGVYRRYLRISVAQKDRALLDKFAAIFGVGAVYCDVARQCHAYQAQTKDAFPIINAMWPWLGERKKTDFKRAVKKVRESRLAADVAVAPKPRACLAPDCDASFVPDVRHPDSPYCSNRCYQRIFARKRRGPAPPRFCSGCQCPVDQRTRGCRRCMTRHWQRRQPRA